MHLRVAFFNRNLRLAHLYGCYGPSNKFDMGSNPLPIVDLTERQGEHFHKVPLHFYETKFARTPVQFGTDRSADNNGNSVNAHNDLSSRLLVLPSSSLEQ